MKPIIKNVPAFDVADGVTVTFMTDFQIASCGIEIWDEGHSKMVCSTPNNSTNVNKFTIPPNASGLKNGNSYLLYIKVIEFGGAKREYKSDPVIIKCITKPSFNLSVLGSSGTGYFTIPSSVLNVGVNYSQADGELLNEYKVFVYDAHETNLICESETVYDVDSSVEINDLANNTAYVFYAIGKTVNGMQIETQHRIGRVTYKECADPSVLTAENDYKNARVILKSNINGVGYTTKRSPSFTPKLDLTDNTLEYNKGLNIEGDFSMLIKFRPTSFNSQVLNINNGEVTLNFKVK